MIPCSEIHDYLDTWLDGELSGNDEARVGGHIRECAECAGVVQGRKVLRNRLRAAVASMDGADSHLRARVKSATSGATRSNRWYFLAAAAVVLIAVGIYGTWLGPGEVMEVGLSQHVHCAINRTYPGTAESDAEMARNLGTSFASLVPVVRQNIPSEYHVVMAHQCSLNQRKFVHVIARNGENLISLLVTRRDTGEAFENDLRAVASEASADLYVAKSEKLSAAGFETPNYFVYLVSNLDEGQNLRVFQAMTPSVKNTLTAAQKS